jgi:hypothetical protein
MLNDLRVRERHAWHLNRDNHPRTGETFYRYFLGVKWSQVQILSARPVLPQVKALFVSCSRHKTGTPRGCG